MFPRTGSAGTAALALILTLAVAPIFSPPPIGSVLSAATPAQADAASKSGSAGDSAPAADLAERLAKFRRVPMPFHAEGLTARERQMVGKLVEASGYLEDMYWRQSDPQGLALLLSLQDSNKPA